MFNNYNQLIAFYRLSSKRRDVSRSSVTASNSSGDIGPIKFIGGLFANNSLQKDSSSEHSASEGSASVGSSSEDSVATRSKALANERRKKEVREEHDGRFGAHNRRKYDNDKEARETDKKA